MHKLTIKLGDKADLQWAQETVEANHYLKQRVHPRARPMVYVLKHRRWMNSLREHGRVGLIMLGIPHATKCRGWWGYDGLPTKWQVVDMCRIWLDPALQYGGIWAEPGIVPGFTDRHGEFRPTVATWFIAQVLDRVQRDRVSLWPPVYLNDPYHIRLVISYHDPAYHKGTIYRLAGAEPLYTDEDGSAVPGPSGKYGWCWRLPEPAWSWDEIKIAQPRTLRLPLEMT